MPYKFFYVPALWPEHAEAELNAFLKRHAVQSVDRELVIENGQAGWSLCVAYLEKNTADPSKRKPGVDYREVLNPTDFDVFSELRRLRKQIAEQQQIPPYTVFSNEQLAAMVTGRMRSTTDLRTIDGVGQARCERYGETFLKMLAELQSAGAAPKSGSAE